MKPLSYFISILTKASFRYNGDLNTNVLGTETYQERDVLVDFRWFILPAVLYVIVAVFFVVTVFTTKRTPIWKFSSLPLLHAMKDEGSMGSDHMVKKELKESRMELRWTGLRWQLIEGTDGRRGSL